MLKNARKFIDQTPYKDFPFDEDSMTREFISMMESGLCFIAEEDGHHFGGVGAVKQPLFFNDSISVAGERFWWVEPTERAGGVGKALLAALFSGCKKENCDYCMMISLDDKASEIYLKMGFVQVERAFLRKM